MWNTVQARDEFGVLVCHGARGTQATVHRQAKCLAGGGPPECKVKLHFGAVE